MSERDTVDELRDAVLARAGVLAAKGIVAARGTVDASAVALAKAVVEVVKTYVMLRHAVPQRQVDLYVERLKDPAYLLDYGVAVVDGVRHGSDAAIDEYLAQLERAIDNIAAGLGAAARDARSGRVEELARIAGRAYSGSGRERDAALDDLLRRTKALLWYREFARQMPMIVRMIEEESLRPLTDAVAELPLIVRAQSVQWLQEYFALTGNAAAQGRMVGELAGGAWTKVLLMVAEGVLVELAVARVVAGATRLAESAQRFASRLRTRLPARLRTPPPIAMSELVEEAAERAASRESMDAAAARPRDPEEALGGPPPPAPPAPRPAAPRPHAAMPPATVAGVEDAIGRKLPDRIRELSHEQFDRLLDKGRRVQNAATPEILQRARRTAMKGQAQEELTARLPELQQHRARWQSQLAGDQTWDASTVQFPTEMRVGNARYGPAGRLGPDEVPPPVKPGPAKPATPDSDDAGLLAGQGVPDEPGRLAPGPDVPLVVLSHDRKRMRILMDVQVKSKSNVRDLAITEDGMGQFGLDRERIGEFASEVTLDLPDGPSPLRFEPENVSFTKQTELVAVTASDVPLPKKARDIVSSDFRFDAGAPNSRLIELHLPMSNAEIDDFVQALVEAMERGKL